MWSGACGCSHCKKRVGRSFAGGDDTQGVGPADMKPSLGDIGPGARRSRYRCERQPKRAIVHTGIPQRPPRGARPARAPWNPNLATGVPVRRSQMPKPRSSGLGVHPRPCTQPDGPPKRPRRPRRAQRARVELQSADCPPLYEGHGGSITTAAATCAPSVLGVSGWVMLPTRAPRRARCARPPAGSWSRAATCGAPPGDPSQGTQGTPAAPTRAPGGSCTSSRPVATFQAPGDLASGLTG